MNKIITQAPVSLQEELNETGKKILELLGMSQESISFLTKEQIFLVLSIQKNGAFLDTEKNVLVEKKGKSRGKLNLTRIQKHFSESEISIQYS